MATLLPDFPVDPLLAAAVDDACARMQVHYALPLTDRPYPWNQITWGGKRDEIEPALPKGERIRIYNALCERYGRQCFYCGSDNRLSLDHLIPSVLVRTWAERNLVLACGTCNDEKADRIPTVLMPLLSVLVHQLVRLSAKAGV